MAILQRHNLSVEQTRGEGYPAIGDDPRKVADYVKRQYELDDPAHMMRLKEAARGVLFADGEHHIDWNKRERVWKLSPNPGGRVRAQINLILPIFRARIARVLSGDLSWTAKPKTNSLEDRDRARLVEQMLPNHWALSDMENKLRLSQLLAYSTGMVGWKQFWNPNIGDPRPATIILDNGVEAYVDKDGNPVVDESGNPIDRPEEAFWFSPGDVDTAIRTVFNLRVNSDATGWTQSQGFRWLIDAEVVPIAVVRERYGEVAKNVQPVPGVASLRTFQNMIRSVITSFGFPVPISHQASRDGQRKSSEVWDRETTLVKEYWEAPSEVQPEGRLIVTAGDITVYDNVLPQGFVPYVPIFDERRPFSPWGRPVIKDLIPPQKVLNAAWSLIIEEMKRHGVGQWAAFDVPGVPSQLTDEHGAIIKVPLRASLQARRISDVIARMPSPTIPRDRWEIVNAARQAMFDIGAFHEISRGQVPPGVDSGVAVELLQEAEVMQLQDAVKGLKTSLIDWAIQRLRIAKWGYGDDEERYVPAGRDDMDYMFDSIKGRDLPDEETIDIDLKGFRPQSQAALRAEVREMMRDGTIPPDLGLRMMDLGRGIEGMFASQTRHYARARAENKAILDGEFEILRGEDGTDHLVHTDGSPFLLAEFDEHPVHLDVLNEIILDNTKPFEVRQAAMIHAVEHKTVLLQQQQEDIQRAVAIEQAQQPQANQKGA